VQQHALVSLTDAEDLADVRARQSFHVAGRDHLTWVRLSAVSAWIAVRVVPVVRLIVFRFPGPGLLNHDDGTSWWSDGLLRN
jgi:hypothetical protein